MSDNLLDGYCRLRGKLSKVLFARLRIRRCNPHASKTDQKLFKGMALYCALSRYNLLNIDVKIQFPFTCFALVKI